MPSAIVVGGGLAGLATTAALANAGFQVDLYEARGFLGGRAASYPVGEPGDVIDNCQHILLRCCVNLMDLYDRLGVADLIEFHREFYFIEPGGKMSILQRGMLPPPFHFAESFARLGFLSITDKLALMRGLLALRRDRKRKDLDDFTMLEWLRRQKQPQRVIDRFWAQVLVSAINEDLDRMSAAHAFQVFWLGFMAREDSYEMGVPDVPLSELYSSTVWGAWENVGLHFRAPVEKVAAEGALINGEWKKADYYVLAVPFERIPGIAPDVQAPNFDHSPITGIHLWFDRSITPLPHATLLDRTIQWMFNKEDGRHIQLVISASRSLVPMGRAEVISLALGELAQFFPIVRLAKLEKAHVVKEVRATFSAVPGLNAQRPGSETSVPNIFLAGDWTQTGWPSTMEGAVRSGYIAAETVAAKAGQPRRFLVPDIA